jgi:hypothetical protein
MRRPHLLSARLLVFLSLTLVAACGDSTNPEDGLPPPGTSGDVPGTRSRPGSMPSPCPSLAPLGPAAQVRHPSSTTSTDRRRHP